MPRPNGGAFFKVSPPNTNAMYELFIELTDQLFYEGYAEQLAQSDPQKFQFEFNDFLNTYSYEMV
jgi:hypothetical protein